MPSQSLSKGWRRDINTERLGYFRTDDATTAALGRLIKPAEAEENGPGFQLLDPCCGEGLSCEGLAHVWGNVTTWGIEYDETRFLNASKRLDHVLNADALSDTFVSSAWASVMLFNPPYGDVEDDFERKSERLEAKFWKSHAARVKRGGLMIAILPVGLFNRAPGMSRAMSHYFGGEKVQIYRAIDQTYHQVVIVGYRRRDREAPPNEELREQLIDLSNGTRDFETLDKAPANSFVIHECSPPDHFDALVLTQAMVEVEVAKEPASVIEDIERDLKAQRSTQNQRRTLTSIRQGHIPLLLAAGGLDGFVADKDASLLVKGSVRRIEHEKSETDTHDSTEGSSTHIRTEKTFKWQTRILAWDITPGRDFPLVTVE